MVVVVVASIILTLLGRIAQAGVAAAPVRAIPAVLVLARLVTVAAAIMVAVAAADLALAAMVVSAVAAVAVMATVVFVGAAVTVALAAAAGGVLAILGLDPGPEAPSGGMRSMVV